MLIKIYLTVYNYIATMIYIIFQPFNHMKSYGFTLLIPKSNFMYKK